MMMMQHRVWVLPIFTAILVLGASLGGQDVAFAANISCPNVSCVALPFIGVAHPMQVAGFITFKDRSLTTYVLGNVINHSNKPIFNTQVRVLGIDGTGTVISRTSAVALPVTFPGQLNPFIAGFEPRYALNSLDVEVISYTSMSAEIYESLTVVTSRTLESGDLEAVFRNDASTSVKNVQATAWWLSPAIGQINTYTISGLLAPNATMTYTFLNYYPASAVSGWRVAAQGIISP